jgi:hypothetical protein
VEPKTLDEICKDNRDALKQMEVGARNMVISSYFNKVEGNLEYLAETYPGQHSEMKAQLMLAVRLLEDARMRFGKVLQYAGDGVSIFDKV